MAGLDALIDQVRDGPDGKVVLMAHSAVWACGALLRRRRKQGAEGLARGHDRHPLLGLAEVALSLRLRSRGAWLSGLDLFFDDDELQEFARHLQGLFFLWPSARYGRWLSIEDRPSPLSQSALLDFVEERDGNRSLLATALGAHAARLDELRTNGVDYQTVIGSGIHTIGSVEIESSLVLGACQARWGVRSSWSTSTG